jgi:hypothetical protein
MRFLADENFPGSAVKALSEGGHDIVWVRTARPGSADHAERDDWAGHFSVLEPARIRMRRLAGR